MCINSWFAPCLVQVYILRLKVAQPDHTKCEAIIPVVVVNQEATLTITLRDSDSNPLPNIGEQVHVYMETTKNTPVANIVKPIREISNGKYEAKFTASDYGDHMISILVGKQHISGSPYK